MDSQPNGRDRGQTARIAPLEPPYEAGVAEHLASLMPRWSAGIEPLKLFRVWGRHLAMAESLRAVGSYILGRGTVDAQDREMLILRVTAVCRAEYEWGVHAVGLSHRSGLSPEMIDATFTDDADSPVWSSRQSLLIALADELHASATVSGELWDRLVRHWSTEQLLELILIVGFYHFVSYTVNAVKVDREDWAREFPSSKSTVAQA